MKNYTLYVHITPSNKLYFGITSQAPKNRWGNNGHNYCNNKYFYNAIKKYGWDNIKHLILLDNLSKDVACACEIYLIKKYDTQNPNNGYNLQPGGDLGNTNIEVSEETRKKLSAVNKGRKLTEEQKKHISDALKGHEITKQHRENLSKALKGKYVKELSPVYGKRRTKENCENISKGLIGHKVSENVMKKSVPAMHTPEAIKKRKETLKHRQFSGVNNAFYGKHHSEATKKIIGERTKGSIWVTNVKLQKNKQIFLKDLEFYKSIGYVEGFTKWKLVEK